MNVYLIGYRGTGKTTVARALAELLGAVAVDADEWLEAAAGCSIRELFATGGEPLFRDHESAAVRVLTARDGLVVSWGGGVILRPENRVALRKGYTVWLRATPATLWQRIAGDPSTGERRPNLTASGGLAEIEQVLAARTPLYAESADCAVDTERATPAEIAVMIAREIAKEFSKEIAGDHAVKSDGMTDGKTDGTKTNGMTDGMTDRMTDGTKTSCRDIRRTESTGPAGGRE
jgi:shikimate kinase